MLSDLRDHSRSQPSALPRELVDLFGSQLPSLHTMKRLGFLGAAAMGSSVLAVRQRSAHRKSSPRLLGHIPVEIEMRPNEFEQCPDNSDIALDGACTIWTAQRNSLSRLGM